MNARDGAGLVVCARLRSAEVAARSKLFVRGAAAAVRCGAMEEPRMKRVVLAIVVAAAICHGVGSAPTVVHAQNAPTPTMCSNGGNVPAGYVVVASSANNNCTAPSGPPGIMYQLQKLPKPSANGWIGPITICAGTSVPPGFVITGWNASNICIGPAPSEETIVSYP
jgi:hypothetical protein